MKKLLLVSPILLVMSLGCSQNNGGGGGWTEQDIRAFIPHMQNVAEVLTRQALTGKDANVVKAVNIIAKDVNASLAGQFAADGDTIDFVVEQAATAAANAGVVIPAVAKPIIKSIMLVGLQSAQGYINQAGLSVSQSNVLVTDFVKAAVLGIYNGSLVPATAAGEFVLPLDRPQGYAPNKSGKLKR